MKKRFQHTPDQPYHISVGAVLVNENGEVCVHKRTRENLPPEFHDALGGLDEVYILRRESLENDESLEESVLRGIREEFGASGELGKYLGSIQTVIQPKSYPFQKTTLYFAVRLTELGARPEDDEEIDSILEWHPIEFLIERMKEQAASTDRGDLDESVILETYVRLH